MIKDVELDFNNFDDIFYRGKGVKVVDDCNDIGIVVKRGITFLHKHPYIKIKYFRYATFNGWTIKTITHYKHDNPTFKRLCYCEEERCKRKK